MAVSAEGDTPRQRIAAMGLHVQSLGHVVWAWRAGRAVPQVVAIAGDVRTPVRRFG